MVTEGVAGEPLQPRQSAEATEREQGDSETTTRAARVPRRLEPGQPCAASVRAHSGTVLRGLYDFTATPARGRSSTPSPWTARGAAGAPTPTATRWATGTPSVWALPADRATAASPRDPDDRFNELFAALS